MLLSPRFAAALSLVFILFLSSGALAQTAPGVSVEGTPLRTAAGGAPLPARPATLAANVLNYDDCVADETLHFRIDIAPSFPAGTTVEAWAGAGDVDCTDIANRTRTTAQCWRVAGVVPEGATVVGVAARVQDILSQFEAPVVDTHPAGDASTCRTASPGPQRGTLQFMATDGTHVLGASASYALVVATDNPSSVGDFIVFPGDGNVHIEVAGSVDPSVAGYDVYCDPQPTNGASTGAGGQCASSTLVAQKGPYDANAPYPGPPSSAFFCGTIDRTGSGTLTPFTNGVTYAIALTPTDEYNTQGYLSSVRCVTPEATAGEGSRRGSGSCAVTPASKSSGAVGLLLGLVAAFAHVRRKRARS